MRDMCFTCGHSKRLKHDPDYWYCTAQKGAPRVYDPSNPTCGNRYRSRSEVFRENDKSTKEDKDNMIISPFKEVSVPKTVFNEDYWKVGDVYLIRTPNTKPRFYVLAEVVETSHVRMEGGVTIGLEEFDNGSYILINHMSLDDIRDWIELGE